MQVFSSHTETSTSGYFSPNGKLLITISADSSLCVYDPRENAPLLRLAPHQTPNFGKFEDGLTALAVSPASNLIAIGGADGGIRIINLPAGNVVGRFPGHAQGESVEGLAFMDILGLAGPGGDGSTKGLLLVSAGTDGKAIIWDVTTGKPRAEVHHEVRVASGSDRSTSQLIRCVALRTSSLPWSPIRHLDDGCSPPPRQTRPFELGTLVKAPSSPLTRVTRGPSTPSPSLLHPQDGRWKTVRRIARRKSSSVPVTMVPCWCGGCRGMEPSSLYHRVVRHIDPFRARSAVRVA
jgi:hypothetical protein